MDGYILQLVALVVFMCGYGLIRQDGPRWLHSDIQPICGLFICFVAAWLLYHGFTLTEFGTWQLPC